MQTPKRLLAAAFALALALASFPAASTRAAAAPQNSALERGYRTGYSDGYQAGYRDQQERAARDYSGKDDYQHADRAYNSTFGALEDYRDGYQQGFEAGYNTGFEARGFDSSVPAGLARRGVQSAGSASGNNSGVGGSSTSGGARRTNPPTYDPNSSDSTARRSHDDDNAPTADLRGTIFIPQDTDLRVELQTRLTSDASQRGDRFDARVLLPAQFAGAVISGRVGRVKRPGKVKGSAELQLDIEQIRLPDGRFANLNGQVIEVVRRTGTGVDDVDPEGGVRGQDRTKDDVTKVGAGAGIGAIIGAIAGGGKGAAIGAVIGAGVGTAGVITSRGEDIRLEPGTELLVRTSTETRIQ
ncbi:MAG TPA: hypothetical protein VF546_21325 [Pyrinomonadaceae bacterium]|jgi:hypothetical protein